MPHMVGCDDSALGMASSFTHLKWMDGDCNRVTLKWFLLSLGFSRRAVNITLNSRTSEQSSFSLTCPVNGNGIL